MNKTFFPSIRKFEMQLYTTCLPITVLPFILEALDKWVEMFQVVYLLSLVHKSGCLLLFFHVSKWKEYTD